MMNIIEDQKMVITELERKIVKMEKDHVMALE